MTKMEQIFIKELKGNFNLRRPKSTKPTPIWKIQSELTPRAMFH